MKVKICGITHADDASAAAYLGADYIGMIFAKRSRRYVTPMQAKEIADAAKEGGAEPVGVFVDETMDEILNASEEAGLKTIQLHGKVSRSFVADLQKHFSALIYAMERGTDETMQMPNNMIPLYDSDGGGRGVAFDWNSFKAPQDKLWFLAGGLNLDNIARAVNLLRPPAVDVSSGVEISNTIRKDIKQMEAFIRTAKKVNQ